MRSDRTAVPNALLLLTLIASGCRTVNAPTQLLPTSGSLPAPRPTPVGLANLNHVIVVMQENHSFDNYFGVLPYAAPTNYFQSANPYHAPSEAGGCAEGDSTCVDGLTCSGTTPESCDNFNYHDSKQVFSTHATKYCPKSPDHQWAQMHQKANFCDPNSSISLSNGFAEIDDGPLPMEFYNETDLPYYYASAETFAISDRYFASLVGPTLPDRMYAMAATSFGHVETDSIDDQPPGPPGYQPMTGSIFDLLDANGTDWAEYYECGANSVPPRPYAQLFRYANIPNFVHLSSDRARQFPEFAAATRGTSCKLPAVSYVSLFNHEHPPYSIQAGQHDVSVIINYLRKGPCWKDSIIFVTYDEGGGYFDHVVPPAVVSPDGIPPGKCADLSNPTDSEIPGGGANCAASSAAQQDLKAMLLPGEKPADFTQLGFRMPLLAISPFAKPHYVSHLVSDHTSILKLIEERFLGGRSLTERDAQASDLSDMFDFVHAPSISLAVSPSVAPIPSRVGGCSLPLPTPNPRCTIPVPLMSSRRRASLPHRATPVVCSIPTPAPTP